MADHSVSTASSLAMVSFAHPLAIKLDDSNFLLCNQQVEAVIIAHKLHRYVVNPTIPPRYASEADRVLDFQTDEFQKWYVQDQMLFAWLLSSLSATFLPCVLGCRHSYEVWDKIQKHFQSHMKAKSKQLRTELKNTKKGTRNINEYVLRIKAICDALSAIGDCVSEQEQIDAILDGLSEEYCPFIMMIYSRADTPSVADIESLLLMQEAQLEKFKPDLGTNVSVNVAQTSGHTGSNGSSNSGSYDSNKGSNDSGNNRGRGSWRGRGGRNGNNSNGRGRGRYGSRPKPTCQICFKYGHDAFNCWS